MSPLPTVVVSTLSNQDISNYLWIIIANLFFIWIFLIGLVVYMNLQYECVRKLRKEIKT